MINSIKLSYFKQAIAENLSYFNHFYDINYLKYCTFATLHNEVFKKLQKSINKTNIYI